MIAEYDARLPILQLHGRLTARGPGRHGFGRDIHAVFTQLKQTLRYGENPHQKAAFYVEPGIDPPLRRHRGATARQGAELQQHPRPRLGAEPRPRVRRAGVRRRQAQQPVRRGDGREARRRLHLAWDGDPLSAFGGILAFNQPVDADTASAIMDPKAKRFIECVIAPDYEPHALDALKKWKENVRLLKTGPLAGCPQGLDYRRVDGGLLVQTRDVGADKPDEWKCVTKRKPTEAEWPPCTSPGSSAST